MTEQLSETDQPAYLGRTRDQKIHDSFSGLGYKFEKFEAGIGAVDALGDAGRAEAMSQYSRSVSWAAEKLYEHLSELKEALDTVRSMVFEAVPGVQTEEDEQNARRHVGEWWTRDEDETAPTQTN
jgi:hypothetical protein